MPDNTKWCTWHGNYFSKSEDLMVNLKIWCSKISSLSGNQRPDLLTSLMNMSSILRLSRKMHLCRSSSNIPRLPSFLEMLENPYVLLTFDKVHNPLRLPRETTSEPPKVLRAPHFFALLTSKCASRHNGVYFFDISQFPKVVYYIYIYIYYNIHIYIYIYYIYIYWLRNVLRATTACTFSTSQFSKVVRCILYILTSKCFAPQRYALFISHLTSWLRTRRFSEPTFQSHKSLEKHSLSRLSYLFARLDLLSSETFSFFSFSRTWIFCLLRLSLSSSLLFSSLPISDSSHLWLFPSLTLPISAFHLSILSEVWLLNFLRINAPLPRQSDLCLCHHIFHLSMARFFNSISTSTESCFWIHVDERFGKALMPVCA